MKNKNQTFLLATVVFLTASLLAGCDSFGVSTTKAQVVVDQPGNNEISAVSASGEVIPSKWVSLGFSGGGQNLGINVNPGDIVSEGKLLAEVDHIGAKAALENARAQLSNVKAQLERLEDLEASEVDIEAAEAAVTAAEASVDQAYAAWMGTYLNAPYEGTIVDVNAHDGENALPGQPIFLLADLTTLQVVTTDMSEVDVVQVKIGNSAEVSFDAFPNITTTGRVAKIGLSKSTGSGVYYKITITMDTIPDELRWGMSAFVVISVGDIMTTSTPTLTSTTTPTSTPTRTPTLGTVLYKAVVLTVDADGVNLRNEPEGDLIKVLLDGTRLEVLKEEKLSDGTIWLAVRTDDGVEGWIVKSAASTVTPTPTQTPEATERPTDNPNLPTETPPAAPTETLTEAPTDPPTETPTDVPTDPPTDVPTDPPTP